MGKAPRSVAISDLSKASEVISMPQKTKVRETVTSSPHLKSKLKEIAQWSEEALSLMRRLPKLSLSAQQELEPELYVALAVLREKITSALREWERVMDEELPDD